MSGWAELFLGLIALATLAMAIVQVGVIIAAGRLARRVDRLADQIEHDLRPLLGHLNTIGRDASRTMGLAAAQVERVDALFADLVVRIDQTLNAVQAAIVAPAREGRALLKALRAALDAIRGSREPGRQRTSRSEDEDALFI
jgi:hypothetical protein